MRWPSSCKPPAKLRKLLAVHSKGLSGSPRVAGSTKARKSSSKLGSVSVSGLRRGSWPAHAARRRHTRRRRPAKLGQYHGRIVLRAIPVMLARLLSDARQNLPREPPPLQIVAARAHRAPASTPRIASRIANSSIITKRYSRSMLHWRIPSPFAQFKNSCTGPKRAQTRQGARYHPRPFGGSSAWDRITRVFGRRARLHGGAFALAIVARAPMILPQFRWQPNSTLLVSCERAPEPPAGCDRTTANRVALENWLAWFEQKLRSNPENWLFWLDKRWSNFLQAKSPGQK